MVACKVYKKVDLKKKDGSSVKLRYQNPPTSRQEEVIEFYIENTLKEDVFVKAAGILKNENALQEYRSLSKGLFTYEPPQVIICCIDDGSENGGKIIGMSTLMLAKSTDSMEDFTKQFPVQTKEMKSLFDLWTIFEGVSHIQKQFDTYFSGFGTMVLPDYRDLGIPEEIIKLRELICKEHNVQLQSEWFMTTENQQAAEKNHWKTEVELKPEEIGQKYRVIFEDHKISFKYMYKILN